MISLFNQLPAQGADIFYTDHWRQLVEEHMSILRLPSNCSKVEVQPNLGIKFSGDFYGLLNSLGLPRQYRWLLLRVNGFTSPLEFTSERKSLQITHDTVIEGLLKEHRINFPGTNIYS
jgi:hypothetical protein